MRTFHYAIAIGVVLVAAGPAAAGLGVSDTSTDTHPVRVENVTQRLTIDLDDDSDVATFESLLAYPARSSSEANAARNGTLEPNGFDGAERIRHVFDETADDGDDLSSVSRSVRHESRLWIETETDPDPEHGWVLVRYEAAWEGYVEPDENVTVGRVYVQALNDERRGSQELRVVAPESWEPAVIEGDPVVEPAGQTLTRYRWTIAGDEPDPLLVFDSPVSTASANDDDSITGAGVIVAVVAVLLVVSIVGVRRRLE